MQKLAKEFVCCTEEVDILFPRNQRLIKYLKDDPAVHLFRDIYGKQVPRHNWDPNPQKTKQGVYAMMPDGTYLSGRFIAAQKHQAIELMTEAIKKWKQLVIKRNLKPQPVPQHQALSTWKKQKQQELGLHIELHYRDLPRKGTTKTKHNQIIGQHYNTTWLELTKQEAQSLIPNTQQWQEVPRNVINKLFTHGLKDIVYGQSPNWKKQDIQQASLKVKRAKNTPTGFKIQVAGTFNIKDKTRHFTGNILGTMTYSKKTQRITKMNVLAVGANSGGTTYNFRRGDDDPAPLGISFYVN